ncbi:MAG TPA: M28 family metallopeptidase [Candidatus Acidoferrum sp.]|nr:M28 family metallopeptidase [Candidatus Acidoferrum sp.]
MKKRYAERRLALWIGALITIALLGGTQIVRAGKDAADEALTTIQPEAIRADMRFLADDLLEGRATGTRGHEIAAKFMASEFEAMGLEPAGDNGTYFQSVSLRSIRPDEDHTTLSIVRGGRGQALTFRQDYISGGDPGRIDTSVEAVVVYVGFGVTAPEQKYDDYAGVEAKGKIAAYLYGAPARFESTMRAHYSSGVVKAQNAAAHGAVGTILLDSPTLEQLYSFKDRVSDLAFPGLRWLDAHGQPNDYFPALRGTAVLSMAGTAKVLEGSGKSPEEIYAAAKEGKPLSLPLPVTAKIKIVSRHEDMHSPNVVARLQGSDPKLRDEYVVYTAHLDHLGIGEPVNGDRIYNGALDNASGSACLLEIARAYSQMKPRPRRSILFVSVTGEEEGLLGSDYFAHYPTVAKDSLVANINMDGAALLWPIEDVVARGAEHSTLDAAVHDAAPRLKLDVSPDPYPEQVLFIRSDQYSFVKQRIPSLFLSTGKKSSNPNIKPEEIRRIWVATKYHKPQDDMNQPFDFESGAKFARYCFLVGYLVAQENERPAWNPGDFFGEHYGHKKD